MEISWMREVPDRVDDEILGDVRVAGSAMAARIDVQRGRQRIAVLIGSRRSGARIDASRPGVGNLACKILAHSLV